MIRPGFIFRDFLYSVADVRHDFERMIKMDPSSSELKALIDRYEKRAQKYYEPTGIVGTVP